MSRSVEQRVYEFDDFRQAAEAEADLAKQFAGASNHPAAFKGYALAKSGNSSWARVVLDELSETSKDRFVPPH